MNYTFSHLPALPLHPTQIGTQQKQYEEAILRALNYKTAKVNISYLPPPPHTHTPSHPTPPCPLPTQDMKTSTHNRNSMKRLYYGH